MHAAGTTVQQYMQPVQRYQPVPAAGTTPAECEQCQLRGCGLHCYEIVIILDHQKDPSPTHSPTHSLSHSHD